MKDASEADADAPRPVISVESGGPARRPTPSGDPSTWLNLALNESQFGPSPTIAAAITAALPRLNRYAWPACTELRETLSAAHGLDPDLIVCGNGSEDVIDNLVRTYLRAGDELLGPTHTWSGFAASARRQGAVLVEAPQRPDWTTDVDALLARLSPRTKMVFLANPNNPLGTLTPMSEVRRLITALPPSVVLCLDAAYAELVTDPSYSPGHDWVPASENLVVTRTLSKVYGLAGARVGWAHAPRAICDALNSMRQMSVVPALCESAAIAAVNDARWVREVAARNAAVRDELTVKLGALGLEVLRSQTNFLAVRFGSSLGRSADQVAASLFADGILVSRLTPYELPDWLRITLPLESDVERVRRGVAKALGRND